MWFPVGLGPADKRRGTSSKEGVQGFKVGAIEGFGVRGPSCLFVIVDISEKAGESLADSADHSLIVTGIGAIRVVVGAIGVIPVVSVVATIRRIVMRAFTLCATFTFTLGRFVRSGVIRRIEVLFDNFFNVCWGSFLGMIVIQIFAGERSALEELFLLFNRSKPVCRAWRG